MGLHAASRQLQLNPFQHRPDGLDLTADQGWLREPLKYSWRCASQSVIRRWTSMSGSVGMPK